MKTDNSGDQSTPAWSDSATAKRPIVLSIAGFDPSSGAGMTADLKVFSSFRIYGMSCITALTVQSTLGVRRVEPLAAEIVRETLETLRRDVIFAGIKIGMLGTAAVAAEVARFLPESGTGRERVVLDPVLRSSSGRALLEPDGIRVLRERILPATGWITPNLEELAILTGLPVADREAVPEAADNLKRAAAALGNPQLNVLVTGGHLERPDDFLLSADGKEYWLQGELVSTDSTHGTGCALSSALLCRLIAGDTAAKAAENAKAYVTAALRAAYPVGQGKGPMHHLFRCDES
jgi:hydroxymethylpyrimidine/phosphomethylpyrimidine kinase